MIPFWLVQVLLIGLLIGLATAAFGIILYVVGFEFDRVFTLGLDRKPEGMSEKRWRDIQATRRSRSE